MHRCDLSASLDIATLLAVTRSCLPIVDFDLPMPSSLVFSETDSKVQLGFSSSSRTSKTTSLQYGIFTAKTRNLRYLALSASLFRSLSLKIDRSVLGALFLRSVMLCKCNTALNGTRFPVPLFEIRLQRGILVSPRPKSLVLLHLISHPELYPKYSLKNQINPSVFNYLCR